MTRLFLIAGLPGAGKTTLALELAARHRAVRLCPDDWFVTTGLDPHDAPLRRRFEKAMWRHGQDLLRAGTSVVLEYGSWARLEREHKRRDARALGVEIELHALDVPIDERWRRLEQRNVDRPGVHITRAQLEEWEHYWQPATPEELAGFDPPLRTGDRQRPARPG